MLQIAPICGRIMNPKHGCSPNRQNRLGEEEE